MTDNGMSLRRFSQEAALRTPNLFSFGGCTGRTGFEITRLCDYLIGDLTLRNMHVLKFLFVRLFRKIRMIAALDKLTVLVPVIVLSTFQPTDFVAWKQFLVVDAGGCSGMVGEAFGWQLAVDEREFQSLLQH